jgi:hypothetical protein
LCLLRTKFLACAHGALARDREKRKLSMYMY